MKYSKKLRNKTLMQNIAQQSGSAALLYGKFNALNVRIWLHIHANHLILSSDFCRIYP